MFNRFIRIAITLLALSPLYSQAQQLVPIAVGDITIFIPIGEDYPPVTDPVTGEEHRGGTPHTSTDTYALSTSNVIIGRPLTVSWNVATAVTCEIRSGSSVLASGLSGNSTRSVTVRTSGIRSVVLLCQNGTNTPIAPFIASLSVNKLAASAITSQVQ